MSQFSYLTDKIVAAPFESEPFKHLLIQDFFTEEHFSRIVNAPQIKARAFSDNRDLVDGLVEIGYKAQPFPGCITDVDEYVAFADGATPFKRTLVKGYGRDVIEGYGLTMRLAQVHDDFLEELITYLNAEEFQGAITEKFGVTDETAIETAYQKNLRHYEISPHCDTSRKALTYMINIYNVDDCEEREMHTHLLRFKPEYRYVYDFWKHNDVDPVWVPWDWCETRKTTNTNNSISLFRPDFDTLHAVRVQEDHLTHQRNQIYGNLWYDAPKKTGSVAWQELDILGARDRDVPRLTKSLHHLRQAAGALVAG